MKNNKVTIKGKNGKSIECRVLFSTHDKTGNNFVVYTNDKIMKDGTIKTYASKYDEDGNLESVTKEEYDFLEKVLNSLQTKEKEKE